MEKTKTSDSPLPMDPVERFDDEADVIIVGLYASGACASNIAQDGKGYSSGTCTGEASFFGRRAGRHAAGRENAAG